jgi:maltoporin
MRSNRLHGYMVVAALFAQASSASAQDTPGDPNTDGKTAPATDDKAAPERVAQAEPAPPPPPPAADQPGSSGPSTPGARMVSEDELRKMVEEQVSKMRPKGPAVEFSGYARAGVGLNVKGGKEVCFVLNGADAKWRLGNECDYVIEPQFTGKLVQRDDGSNWGVVVMPGLYRTWDSPGPAFNDVPSVFRQIYFYGENIPELLHGRVWGGRRYYDRLHLDINDQFLEIHDSDGAGLEDMKVGPGKLSIAFLMNPNSEANPVPNPTPMGAALPSRNFAPFSLSARFTDIPTVPEGALQLWAAVDPSSTSPDVKPGETGVAVPKPDTHVRVGVYHTLGKVLGGSNLVGAKADFFGSNELIWRLVTQQQMQFNNGHTGVDVIAEFRSDRVKDANDNTATNNWLSVGGRIDHQIAGPFRFLFEAGIDHVFAAAGGSPNLIKVTPCLAINAGDGPGARPTVRLFYTHGFWNSAAQAPGLGVYTGGTSGSGLQQVYGDATNGGSFGLQAEAWW